MRKKETWTASGNSVTWSLLILTDISTERGRKRAPGDGMMKGFGWETVLLGGTLSPLAVLGASGGQLKETVF